MRKMLSRGGFERVTVKYYIVQHNMLNSLQGCTQASKAIGLSESQPWGRDAEMQMNHWHGFTTRFR